MINRKRHILVLGILTVFISAGLLSPGLLFPGDLDPTDPPGSTMHTLEDIYEMLSDNNAKLNANASVEKTGQTTSYATGDDGDLMKGVAWPDPRFTDNGDGTVTDNLTGLIWMESANCFGQRSWSDALADCNNLANGSCGLTDGSVAGDWRLPNVKELLSLIDYGHYGPALPAGHPFTSVMGEFYWSSTTEAFGDFGWAYNVPMDSGSVRIWDKGNIFYVWPVRGGN